ncbi:MAG TPA: sigma 54-interacting transcriptional regulator [Kofleriaceae bacterium]|nr:sigma 54-interacting transcriptional regulator [Kofleriaceae bacterium]
MASDDTNRAADTVSVTREPASGEPRDHSLVRQLELTVLEGPDAGKTFRSTAERSVIGTHRSCSLVLSDKTVSRFHCDISPGAGGKFTIRDLGSRNGLLLNGCSVVEAHLHDGVTISLGRTLLRFEPDAGQVTVPLSARESFGLMVGSSRAMRAVFSVLERAAESDVTVLLQGETGTGKELAAESIHRVSSRGDGPFIVVDCGAIPADLLESELFGHVRGAFTGAVAERAGAFSAASGGTIFLDEIGELSPELQPRLLRALERREVKPVGKDDYHPIDVRVIAATNRDLCRMVNEQSFRSDLYYRLAVVEVRLPPLRERPGDLPDLVDRILAAMGEDGPAAAALRAPAFRAALARHGWPGNVRELRNYVERCIALREQPPLVGDSNDLAAPSVDISKPLKQSRENWLRSFEREYVAGILREHGDNVSAAARAAGVDRVTFYRLMWKLGLR